MTTISHSPTAFAIRAPGRLRSEAMTNQALRLRPSEDGWSLITPDGAVLLRGRGLGSRRQCLERARELGALTVLV